MDNNSIRNDMFHNLMVVHDNVSYDLMSYFFSQRVIWFFQSVSDVTAHQLCMQLVYLANINTQPIYINIQSCGGSVYAIFSVANTIRTIRAPVYTTACGFAASAAAFLLIIGAKGHRFALPHARIMLHQVISGGRPASFQDLNVSFEETKYLNTQLLNIMFDNINILRKEFDQKIERDWYLSAEQALEIGVIDHIVDYIPDPNHQGPQQNIKHKPEIIIKENTHNQNNVEVKKEKKNIKKSTKPTTKKPKS